MGHASDLERLSLLRLALDHILRDLPLGRESRSCSAAV